MSIVYDVFKGNSSAGPIDYTTVVTTTSSLSVVLAALALGSSTRFGVRTRDTVTGLSDHNTDARVLVTVSAAGADVTLAPRPPQAVRALPAAGATVVVEWAAPDPDPTRTATGFHVYIGTGSVSYTSAVATVLYSTRRPGQYTFRATLTGLTDGTTYQVGVRAYNAAGEETNTSAVAVTASGTGPTAVASLSASLSY